MSENATALFGEAANCDVGSLRIVAYDTLGVLLSAYVDVLNDHCFKSLKLSSKTLTKTARHWKIVEKIKIEMN